MAVTRIGDHMASAHRRVEVVCRRDSGHVPIHHRQTEERAAALWDLPFLPENATFMNVQVRLTCLTASTLRLLRIQTNI